LLDSLRIGGGNLTHGMIHRRLAALVNQSFENQTPMFRGDSQRYFFSKGRMDGSYPPTITVKRVDGQNPILEVGAAQGMLPDLELAIYPWNTREFNESNLCSRVRVIEVYELESKTVSLKQTADDNRVEAGFQAVALKPPRPELAVTFQRRLNSSDGDMFRQLEKEIRFGNAQNLSATLASAVRMVSLTDTRAAYHIGVENHQYNLLNTANRPIRHFPSSTDPKQFLRSLCHLARFEKCRSLENLNVPRNLKGKFSFVAEAEGLCKNSVLDFHLLFGLQLIQYLTN
jgi:hypothetical protein